MARPRLPDQIKKQKGTFRKVRKQSPPPSVLVLEADPPSHLSPTAQRVWMEIVPKLIKSKIVSTLDIVALTTLCEELGFYYDSISQTRKITVINASTGKVTINKDLLALRRAANNSLKTAMSLMARFGLTPTDRQKIVSGEAGGAKSPDDPMSDFLNQ